MSAADARLGPSDHVILGILSAAGPMTTYGLKRAIASSVGYFWPFPHAQLYAETARLARLGLLSESEERGGRRRRVYSVTPGGRAAVEHWLATPTPEPAQFRDLGLLKLAFGSLASPEAVAALARDQAAAHAERLLMYEAYAGTPMDPHVRATLELGLRYERAALDFWREEVPLADGRSPEP
jgi:PadR family transcriptional regulator, regulatory protein AphA